MIANQTQHDDEINVLKKLARKSRTIQMKLRYDAVRLNLEGRTKKLTEEQVRKL